jgi:hypothetical protein
MKAKSWLRALLFENLFQHALATSRAIFLFKDVMKSNTTALQTSNFNTLIIFGLGILSNGDIKYYSNTPGSVDVVVASNGSYTGSDALASKMRSFKTANLTTVTRLEISMNSKYIKELIANPGPGSDTRLFRNFVALKTAWDLDAVNNDDESVYDAASTVMFGKMLGEVGYKYTIAPYTNINHWINVKTQLNKGLVEPNLLLDRVYLQCYDGGTNNDLVSWQSKLGLMVVPILWVTNDSKPSYSTTAAQAKKKFTNWNQRSAIGGGGYWNDLDIEKMGLSYQQYGEVLMSVFSA